MTLQNVEDTSTIGFHELVGPSSRPQIQFKFKKPFGPSKMFKRPENLRTTALEKWLYLDTGRLGLCTENS